MSAPAPRRTHLVIVVAADAEDYLAWCEAGGRQPMRESLWALTPWTGELLGLPRTFQTTARWREDRYNRRLVARLMAKGVPYGDACGPWPTHRVPDLAWPRWWQRRKPPRPRQEESRAR